MANEENLKKGEQTRFRAGEEQAETARKGGIASGASRRRKKAMRKAAADLLNMDISNTSGEAVSVIKTRLRNFGFDPEDATLQDAMLLSVMIKALRGDVRASEFIRDTAGNNPAIEIKKEELKLRKAELEIKRKSLLDDSKPDRDENNLLEAIKDMGEINTDDLPEVK